MIYDRWGIPLVVTGNLGEVHPEGFVMPLKLVAVQIGGATEQTYRFAEFLKADKGLKEVDEVIAAAPIITPDPELLGRAIRAAI